VRFCVYRIVEQKEQARYKVDFKGFFKKRLLFAPCRCCCIIIFVIVVIVGRRKAPSLLNVLNKLGAKKSPAEAGLRGAGGLVPAKVSAERVEINPNHTGGIIAPTKQETRLTP